MTQDKGHYVAYQPWRPGKAARELVDVANKVIEEYEAKGFAMTLRQLYYRLVVANVFPNSLKSYNHLKEVISKGRLAGLVSWTAIEDRGRNLRGVQTYSSPEAAILALRESYRLDLWQDQEWRPEVWVEKQALEGVIADAAVKLRVSFYATKGFNSQSEQWRAGRRFAGYIAKGQRPIVFHLADHDPSGLDMTRDNAQRLEMFAGVPVQVVRIALNMAQVERHNLVPNPAKQSDSRFEAYADEFGDSSWELDALPPDTIQSLITTSIDPLRDMRKWNALLLQEEHDRQTLLAMAGGDDDDL